MFNSAFEYIGVAHRGHIAAMKKEHGKYNDLRVFFLRAVEFSVFWGGLGGQGFNLGSGPLKSMRGPSLKSSKP